MQSHFLKFYDFIIDGSIQEAKDFFNNPFSDEQTNNHTMDDEMVLPVYNETNS